MATVALTKLNISDVEGVIGYQWTSLGNADDGVPLGLPNFADKTIQVIATAYGSATLVIEGSIDGTNWVTLTDGFGNALSFTSAAQCKVVHQNTLLIRPRTSGGTGTNLTVQILLRRPR